MKTSVVIIAHNEELHIERCIKSVLDQRQKADEVILVLHNCTDNTKEIAQAFPVRLVDCNKQGGPIVSRACGIENSLNDIVCCTDGDCWVDKNWVKNISKPLIKNKDISIVAGYTKILNNYFWRFSCWWQFVIQRKVLSRKNHSFAWGSNFAFRKKDYYKVGGLFPFLRIHKDLNIKYVAEDLYISLALQKIGKIFYALNANVFTYIPQEKSSLKVQKVIIKNQLDDNKKLFSFFKF